MKTPGRQVQVLDAEEPTTSDDEDVDARSTEDPGYKPETVQRRCTDVVWCAALLVAIIGTKILGIQALPVHAQFFRLTHLRDHLGNYCGVGDMWDRPLLYFCECRGGFLSWNKSICSNRCPTNTTTGSLCPCKDVEFQYGNETSGMYIMDYTTTVFMGMVCRPTDGGLLVQISHWFEATRPIANIAMMWRARFALALSAFAAIFAAHLFIGFLNTYSGTLVWGGIAVVLSILIGAASYLLVFCVHLGQCTGDSKREYLIFAIAMLIAGLSMCRFASHARQEIELSIDCITWASTFMMNAKSLALIPFATLVCRLAVCACMSTPFRVAMSTTNRDMIVKRDMAKVSFASPVVTMILFLWLQLIISAASDFVTMHATSVWYFRDGMEHASAAPRFLALRSMWVACRYHAGTLIFGAVIIGALTPLRVIGRSVSDSCDLPPSSLYCEVARCSSPLWPAWKAVSRLVDDEENLGEHSAMVLNGATRVFKLAGLALRAVLGYVVTLIYTMSFSDFTDMSSDRYLPNPLLMHTAGGFAALICAFPYMNLFDTISDTILYCHSIESKWSRDEETAQAVRDAAMPKTWSDQVVHLARDFGCYCGYRAKESEHHPMPTQVRGRSAEQGAAAQGTWPEVVKDGAWHEAGRSPEGAVGDVPDAVHALWQETESGAVGQGMPSKSSQWSSG